MTLESPPLELNFTVVTLVQPCPECTPIDRASIRSLCYGGLSECPPEDRCVAWLVLLGLFPDDPFDWAEKKATYRVNYEAHVSAARLDSWHTKYVPRSVRPEFFPVDDPSLMWAIHIDVVRTGRHIFFLPAGDPPDGAPDNIEGAYAVHMRRIERMLYVFSQQNGTVSYLQGFNELCVPLYFVNHGAIQWLGGDIDCVEALTFACFERLLTGTDIKSYYPKSDVDPLIHEKMNEFMALLKKHLPRIHRVLGELEIEPLEFAVRWFTLLYAQDYQLPDILIIWDSLFAHMENMMEYMGYVVIAHLELVQDQVSAIDMTITMRALQHARARTVVKVLSRAHEIWVADHTARKPRFSFFR
jgi:hypothetical protein